MMVVPTYKDYLEIPGGYIECGETPTQAVAREVKEELGDHPADRAVAGRGLGAQPL